MRFPMYSLPNKSNQPIKPPKVVVSKNLCKIVTFFLLIATVAALFFLRSIGDSATLFCFRNQAKIIEKIELPNVDWSSIEPIADKTSKFVNFRSERWIVVSVLDHPSDSLRNLVKIKGWQVLAIGNSRTPSDWSLKGSIFLSLEEQANLGFRVVDYLPYDSYVRKTVGYLFAIQHGAKVIFDADNRGNVIGGDLGKHFDLELNGEGARKEVILQYSHEIPNRTVVNSYVHFGQRSVWPRGLPLENVGEIGHEEFYTEVFGGKKFILQGISNGLPDVDSVFYFTRKSGSQAFDELAPKVALPQGLMVPVNSFNTLFHSSAFWALMLPVSVSTMASDVLRGYWGQRLLWEVGGYVVVYPPTVYRYDKVEAYPFSEEKDLHVNVSRLIKYLVSWRSSKHGLFEKVLDLSYEMAEEGFWTEMDLKFTTAWLQDLIAVGYNGPVKRTTLEWRLLCGRIFKTVVILLEKKDLGLAVEESNLEQAYKHLPKIFDQFSSAEGFLFLQDDTILNYWTWYPNHGVLYPNQKTVGFHSKQAWYRSSEVFYVPRPFTDDFVELVNLIGNLEIHQKVAIPMIYISIDSPKNFDFVLDKIIYKQKVPTNSSTHYSAKVPAVHPWNVASEQEFIKLIRIMAEGDPLLMELV
ncbi:hypothetical protein RIF29_39356 [Crotalaria pallida]|uniref:Glycosyltransferase n=1 Tax=Crotalaria pallida TaxID=3830 RepID=A0AAN9HT75_CROPI